MIDPNLLSNEQLFDRGWQAWDENLVLCPESDFLNINDGVELVNINGGHVIKGKDYIDMDTRWGFLAYGIERNVS